MESGKCQGMMKPMKTTGPLQEKSYRYALDVVLFCKRLVEERREFVLSKQLLKSGTSVGANIEEAQQAQSRNDFVSKLSIALKEGYESRFWLRLIHDSGYDDLRQISALTVQVDAIISMLVRSIKTAKDRS